MAEQLEELTPHSMCLISVVGIPNAPSSILVNISSKTQQALLGPSRGLHCGLFLPCSFDLCPCPQPSAGYSVNCPSGQLQSGPVILSSGEVLASFTMGPNLHPFPLELGCISMISSGVTLGQTSVVVEGDVEVRNQMFKWRFSVLNTPGSLLSW